MHPQADLSIERMRILSNWAVLNEHVSRAADRVGTEPNQIKIVAVTKTVTVQTIQAAHDVGITIFGENRVQEAVPKIEFFKNIPNIEWHMIGHLQTNKAKKAVEHFRIIQSVDSLKLAGQLSAIGTELRKKIDVLVEVNISGEQSKSGIPPEALQIFLEDVGNFQTLCIRGLMTIGPLSDDQSLVSKAFRNMKKLYDEAKVCNYPNCRFEWLSMGMSGDFEIAIAEGSNMIRIGRAIFGERREM